MDACDACPKSYNLKIRQSLNSKVRLSIVAAMAALCANAQLESVFEKGTVSGTVIYHFPSEAYCFVEGTDGNAWRIATPTGRDISNVKEGDVIKADGDVLLNGPTHQMYDAAVFVTGRAKVPDVVYMSPGELHEIRPGDEPWRRAWFGRMVSTSGQVIDINRRATYTQLVIGPAETPVMASIPLKRTLPLPEGLEAGAKVRVTGVGVYRCRRDGATGSFLPVEDIEVRLRGLKGLEIITQQPFWTVGRVAAAFGAFAIVMFGIVALIQRGRIHDRIAADAIRRERLRLTSELHDNFQQLLAGCMFRLGAAVGKVGKDDAGARKQLDLLCNSLNHAQAALRAALWGLAEEAEGPTALSELFRYAASRMPQWAGVVQFEVNGRERSVARKCSGALLLILQEAVGNAIRHGLAKNVLVSVDFAPSRLVFQVKDDGIGFDVQSKIPFGHLGLVNMRRHAAGLGGTFAIDSHPGQGTNLTVEIPL